MVAAWNPWHHLPAGLHGQFCGGWGSSWHREQFAAGVLRPGASGWTGQPFAAHQRAMLWGLADPASGETLVSP